MTFPVDAARANTRVSSSASPHVVNIPGGGASAGQLLIWLMAWDGNPGAISWPAGWTLFDSGALNGENLVAANGGALFTSFALYRFATGSEGATVSADPTNNEASNSIIWKIDNADPVYPPRMQVVSASNNAPNPPAMFPGWGPVDVLWLAACTADIGTNSISGSPTNYGSFVGSNGGAESGGVGVRGGSRQLNATTEDPGAFSLGATVNNAAITIAVKGLPDQAVTDSPMDFDSFRQRSDSSADTNCVVKLLPDRAVGDGIGIWFGVDGTGGVPTITAPSGWDTIFVADYGTADNRIRAGFYWRVMDGSEGSTVTFVLSGARGWNSISTRVKGHLDSSPPEAAQTGGTTGANVDPPNLTPSWGSKPTLWLALGGVSKGDNQLITGTPTGYGRSVNSPGQRNHVGQIVLRRAARNLTAASDNPSTMTSPDSAVAWIAATVAILHGPSGRSRARYRSWVA